VLTLIPLCQEVPCHKNGLFELYGFDFIIDDNFKTWILEVNLSPALSIESDTDLTVKKKLIMDALDILNFDYDDGNRAYKDSFAAESKPAKGKPPPHNLVQSGKSFVYSSVVGSGFQSLYPVNSEGQESLYFPKIGDPKMKGFLADVKKAYKSIQ
jgi:hypothetical protein